MRKTKIVATIGPASAAEEDLEELVDAGMDVARQNFSHGTHDEHADALEHIREIAPHIPVMLDTQGPEVRLSAVEMDLELQEGSSVTLLPGNDPCTEDELWVDYDYFVDRLEEGDRVLIGDGDIELVVTEAGESATCDIVYGGILTHRKSVNVPGKDIGPTGLTEKDVEDIRFGLEEGFDYISVSFVKTAKDIRRVREYVDESSGTAGLIAKIEDSQAVENFEEILQEADGIMIARGDLGVELSSAEIPLLQKTFMRECNRQGKPVIVATQMLSSMTDHPHATRAEISDIANAVLDGTDAVMLSEETAIGSYPSKAVSVMADVVETTEEYLEKNLPKHLQEEEMSVEDVIAKSIWQASRDLEPAYILAHTSSGYTARNIARYRPQTPIIAFTYDEAVRRRLGLVWGVQAFTMEFRKYVNDMIHDSAQFLFDRELVTEDDLLVISGGIPTATSGTTNLMEIHTVSDIISESEW